MPRKPIDLPARIAEILDHVGDLPPEAEAPISHYILSSNAAVSMRRYVLRKLKETGHHPATRDKHFVALNNMVLVNLIQSFERFIKDLAAVCVDHLFDRTIDGRFDEPQVRGSSLAAHFAGSSPGKALCESGTWLDCKGINERFKDYLRHPTDAQSVFHVFAPNSDTFRVMNLIWQLRHTIVHNVGVITRSDAAKLRLLAKKKLPSPRILLPTPQDLRFLEAYLDNQVEDINKRAGERLAAILTVIHASDPTLFAPQEEADAISRKFGSSLTVAGVVGIV
jgi:hypothetical protein